MEIKIVETTRQILVNNVPIEGLIGTLAFIVAAASLFIAIKAVRESARANTLNYLPVITLDYNNDNDKVVIKNIGRGAAVDVVLDKYYSWSADKNFNLYGLSIVEFEKVNILDAGESVSVDNEVKGLGDSLGILTFTIFSKHTKKLDFIVKFRDISGKKYLTVIHIQEGKVVVRNFPRGMGLRTLITLAYLRFTQAILAIIYFVLVKYKKFIDESKK